MKKKVAVLVLNPVNGSGLFQYLETFYENKIPFDTFAVSPTVNVSTNSGVSFACDYVVADLLSEVDKYEAVVFACGDAFPKFKDEVSLQHNKDLVAVLHKFNDAGKQLIGHCGFGFLLDTIGIGKGKTLAMHSFVQSMVNDCNASNKDCEVDGNIYTAQNENTLHSLLPSLVESLV